MIPDTPIATSVIKVSSVDKPLLFSSLTIVVFISLGTSLNINKLLYSPSAISVFGFTLNLIVCLAPGLIDIILGKTVILSFKLKFSKDSAASKYVSILKGAEVLLMI